MVRPGETKCGYGETRCVGRCVGIARPGVWVWRDQVCGYDKTGCVGNKTRCVGSETRCVGMVCGYGETRSMGKVRSGVWVWCVGVW